MIFVLALSLACLHCTSAQTYTFSADSDYLTTWCEDKGHTNSVFLIEDTVTSGGNSYTARRCFKYIEIDANPATTPEKACENVDMYAAGLYMPEQLEFIKTYVQSNFKSRGIEAGGIMMPANRYKACYTTSCAKASSFYWVNGGYGTGDDSMLAEEYWNPWSPDNAKDQITTGENCLELIVTQESSSLSRFHGLYNDIVCALKTSTGFEDWMLPEAPYGYRGVFCQSYTTY